MKLLIPNLGDKAKAKTLLTSTTGLITLALVMFKLAGIVKLPWWAVLGPLWMPFVAVLALLIVVTVCDMLLNMLAMIRDPDDDLDYDDDDFWNLDR